MLVCNYCPCCRELLAGVQAGYTEGIGKTGYRVAVDTELCSSCGLCVKACNVEALNVTSTDDSPQLSIAEEVCLGCGACISSCPQEALSMIPVVEPIIPHKKKELMKQILKEKGRMTPFVIDGIKQKVRKLLP